VGVCDTEEQPKPLLVRLLEGAAAIMGLDEGQTSLKLHFDNGHLRRWTARDSNNA
jgi:hypothetical protein